MTLDEYLNEVYINCTNTPPSRHHIKTALENLLAWLNEPANNTDANCRKVDLFVTLQIELETLDTIPSDIKRILFDMGGQLHDTHTSPDVAQNFESTPQQLLERVRKLL